MAPACAVLGGLIGALLPFAARRIGTDPATLSPPMITSIMDLLGVLIYFGLVYAFLGHMLVGSWACKTTAADSARVPDTWLFGTGRSTGAENGQGGKISFPYETSMSAYRRVRSDVPSGTGLDLLDDP